MAERLPSAFLDGVRHFNAGRYFEAHEAFEELLDSVESDGRWDLLVALIQVAVGYHKLAAGHAGGRRMLGLGVAKLDAFPPLAFGVRVGALRRRVRDDLAGAAEDPVAAPGAAHPAPPRIQLVGSWRDR